MFNRILVAVDKSLACRVAYQRAIALAKIFNAKLMIFHALFEHEVGSPDIPAVSSLPYIVESKHILRKTYAQRWQAFEDEYTSYLRWLTKDAQTKGVDAEFSLSQGDPGQLICDVAQVWKADILVAGSQNKSAFREFFLGSVSNYLTHHAPCNILIVHETDRLYSSKDDESNDSSVDESVPNVAPFFRG